MSEQTPAALGSFVALTTDHLRDEVFESLKAAARHLDLSEVQSLRFEVLVENLAEGVKISGSCDVNPRPSA